MGMKILVFLASVAATLCRELGSYNIDVSSMSVSGISSGACMATQFHVAYSRQMVGVGLFAGTPYWCARENIAFTTTCMISPWNINMPAIFTRTQSYSSSGAIDATSNLRNDKIFLFHGTLDGVVNIGALSKTQEFYQSYVQSSNIRIVNNMPAAHAMPTSHYGRACNVESSPYINNCNYAGAYHMLDHIYGGLQAPNYGSTPQGSFYEFDQRDFFALPPSVSGMDTEGYVYVPSGCVSGQNLCRLHIVFHGCGQGRYTLQDEYARHSGYNEVGEANNIIMLYPQAISSFANPNGCWDWWGYNTPIAYATKSGHQGLATCRMMQKITGGTGIPCPS